MRHGKAKVIHQQPMKQRCVPLELLLSQQELRAGGEDAIGSRGHQVAFKLEKVVLSHAGSAQQEALDCENCWLAKKKEEQGGETPSKHIRGRHAAHFLPKVRRLRGWGNSMSPFCSQLAGVGGAWNYC